MFAGRRKRSAYWKNTPVFARLAGSPANCGRVPILGSSYNAVKCKAEEIGRSLRLREGYSRNDLAELFGTTQSTISKWFAKGWLTSNGEGRVTDDEVLHFIAQHACESHFKRVDEPWLKGLLFGCPARNRLARNRSGATACTL